MRCCGVRIYDESFFVCGLPFLSGLSDGSLHVFAFREHTSLPYVNSFSFSDCCHVYDMQHCTFGGVFNKETMSFVCE